MATQFNQETINALEDAIIRKASGKAVVEYEIAGRKVKYDTMNLDEMQGLLRTMTKAVNAEKATKGTGRRRYALLTTGKGL